MSQETQFIKAGYYGDIGTGKTTDLAAMAKLGPVVYIDSESGLESKPLAKRGIPTENILPFRDIRWDALDDLYWQLKAGLDEHPGSIAGVNLDSMTEIVAKLVEQTNDAEIERQIRKLERRGEDTEHLNRFRIDVSSWGIVTEMVRRLFRHYRDLPCHFAWAALERRDVDETDGMVRYGPKVNPGLQGDITGYVSVVLHTWVDGEDADGELFVAHTRRAGKYTAKDRLDATPHRLAEPTFDRLFAYVNGDLTIEKDEDGIPLDPVQARYIRALRSRRDQSRAAEQAAAEKEK